MISLLLLHGMWNVFHVEDCGMIFHLFFKQIFLNFFHVFHFFISGADRELRLDATDLPAPGFVQAFCASQQLSQAIAAERHCNANGQASTDCCGDVV